MKKRKKYIPPIINVICLFLLCISVKLRLEIPINVCLILFGISLLACYIEAFVVVIPHIRKNKRINNVDKKRYFLEGTFFSATFIMSYISEYIYKDKKQVAITNIFSIIYLIGVLWFFKLIRN